jgi:cytochrome c556
MRFRVKAVAIGVAVAMVAYLGNAIAAETLEIKDCMKCQNKSRKEISDAAKGGKWDDASTSSKAWLEAAEAMGKNDPPLGDKKSWKDQTDKYLTNVKAVDSAVGKKDPSALTKALGTFGASCGGCHSKHKPK